MLRPTIQIAKREFVQLWKDSRLRTVVFFAPFLYAGLFCLVYSKHSLSELPIAIVQEDSSQPARTLVRMLEMSPKLQITERVFSRQELTQLIHNQSVDAAVFIPSDFTAQLKRGQDTRVVAYINASSMVAANTAAKAINEVVQTFSAGVEIKTLMKKGDSLEAAKKKFMPVKLDLRSLFNPAFNYSNFMIPGLLMAILQQVILLGVALSWTAEIEFGKTKELFAISRSPTALFLGKALPYFLINWVVAEFYLRVLFPINDIPMEGSWLIAIPFTLLFIATIVTWGIWVSGLCKTRLFATQALMFVAMPSFILSGFTWPHEGMPWFVVLFGKLLPLTYFVNSFRQIYLTDAPWEFIWPSFAAVALFLVINIAACYWVIGRLLKKQPSEYLQDRIY